MKFYKLIALIICFIILSSNISAQVYEVEPNVANCECGSLTMTEKQKIINFINKVRKHHKLGEIVWSNKHDKRVQSAALSMLATGIISHSPVSGKCSSADSDSGRASSNLSIKSSTVNDGFSSIEHLIGWLKDNHSQTQPHSVGHRRLIINPFLSATCLGKAEGPHPTNTGWYLGTAALWGINTDVMAPSTCANDFVAYPYENYPIDWVDKTFYLSFSPLADPSWWWGGKNKVAFDNAVITMTTESGQAVQVSDKAYDYDAWGCFINNLSWKVVGGLKDEVKYFVKISNVIVNGSTREYSYWFKLTNQDDDPVAVAPELILPVNGEQNIDLTNPVCFRWKRGQNLTKYELQLSYSKDFTYIFDNFETSDTNMYVSTLVSGQQFYWRVAGFPSGSDTPLYSSVWSFTTKAEVIDPPLILNPKNNAVNVYQREVYRWTNINSAIHYRIQISENETNKIVVDESEIVDTTYYLTAEQALEKNTSYSCRVSANLSNGTATAWSDIVKFTTGDNYSSINEPEQLVSSIIYPNPTRMSFAVSMTLESPANNLTISITDVNGRIIKKENYGYVTAGNLTYYFNTGKLSNGIYNIILTIDGKSKVEKLVIYN